MAQAYDHPFADGNGRTARALFYWSMLRNRYWLFEFISISQILLRAPSQYCLAFLHTETDENDLTYFLLHQTDVILAAIKKLHDYIDRETRQVQETRELLRNLRLNHRQEALLAHALKHPGYEYSIAGHQAYHHVVYQTGRTDLLSLESLGLLKSRLQGKRLVFSAPSNIADEVNRLNDLKRNYT